MTAGSRDDERKQVPMGQEEISPPAERPPAAEFKVFFNRLYPVLVNYGAVIWGSIPDAEEAASDSLVYIYRHWHDIDNKDAYARTMVTRAIGRLRKNAARRADQLNQAGPAGSYADSNDGSVTECVQRQWITELLATLPPAQRAVMAGFFDQVPTADIAAAIGKTEAAVRKNLQLARRRLQQELERERVPDLPRRHPVPVVTSTPREVAR
ncbi:RNA polymerase sigma factor [Paractinoplanes lichenicola]|uniref:Sigma-70 family RNA polymerase sigma factor n=1 Tax=Paractinoplanes lichenicola TaxID=2802976 RepID=A0ABS1W2S9_9ACTN|nr:sigma-70 family RNA polymerase sigma factor [Actinoplanes lichenicola]MBL7261050.1 sigma-70 family RNA polymerase sigma factor [Actinoplanes lichenicola]